MTERVFNCGYYQKIFYSLFCTFLLVISLISDVYPAVETKLLAIDGDINDYFGNAVSISGNRAIVGSWQDNEGENVKGSAFIYFYNGNSWIFQQKISASDGFAWDYFGYSVSINGNYALVGAYGANTQGADAGAAYIYFFNGNSWVQLSKLTASDKAQEDRFGYSVALDSDFAIIGSPGDDDMGNNSGSAYIFRRVSGVWTQQAKLLAIDGQAGDFFGCAVSIKGNYALVGAFGDDDNGNEAGSAYIYFFNGVNWVLINKLLPSQVSTSDQYGSSVSITDNFAIVGAKLDNDKGTDSGSAYIFKRESGSWVLMKKLLAPDGQPYDNFGYSVAIDGSVAIIGAPYDDDKGADSGSFYIFEKVSDDWVFRTKITSTDAQPGNNFGYSVCLSGGYGIIGSPYDDDKAIDAGSAYIYDVNFLKLVVPSLNFYGMFLLIIALSIVIFLLAKKSENIH